MARKRGLKKTMEDPAPLYRPRMRDPVSGQKMQKGRPVPAAFSSQGPDDGQMPARSRVGVPRQGMGFGSNLYTPDPRRPHIQRFKQSPASDRANVTGRVINPMHEPTIRGGLEGDAVRRGRPMTAYYSGDFPSKMRMGLDQAGLALGLGRRASARPAARASKVTGTPLQRAQASMPNTRGYEDFPQRKKGRKR